MYKHNTGYFNNTSTYVHVDDITTRTGMECISMHIAVYVSPLNNYPLSNKHTHHVICTFSWARVIIETRAKVSVSSYTPHFRDNTARTKKQRARIPSHVVGIHPFLLKYHSFSCYLVFSCCLSFLCTSLYYIFVVSFAFKCKIFIKHGHFLLSQG